MAIAKPNAFFDVLSIQQLISDILREAARQGATAAEVDVGFNKGFNIMLRMGEAETVEYNQDKSIDVTVYIGKRSGSASLSDIRTESIQLAVKAACNIARFADEDAFSGLAERELLAFDAPTLDIHFPWQISVPEAIAMAQQCETIALNKNKRITNSEGVSIATSEVWQGYGNSHGFIGVYPLTHHEISCVLIAKEKEDMQRDYSFSISCDPKDLDSLDTLAATAVDRTVKRLGGKCLPTMKVPVVFQAEEARSLLGHFVAANHGSNLYRKSSFLIDHLGKQIFPQGFRIDERPYLSKMLGSSAFDNDGVATRNNIFVEDGILQLHALSTYSGRKLGMPTTANAGGVHNLFISTGTKDLSLLLKTMDKGLLVTELMGQGVNLVTGDYSRGAAGFWVENGAIQYPVEEITIAGNLSDIYKGIIEVGSDIDKRGNIQTGSILINEMMVAGQ